MTPEQFCYWLQGFMEMTSVLKERPAGLTEQQRKVIEDHLTTVFAKVTPDRSAKKVLNEKKKPETIADVIEEMQQMRPDVYCTTAPGRIC